MYLAPMRYWLPHSLQQMSNMYTLLQELLHTRIITRQEAQQCLPYTVPYSAHRMSGVTLAV